MPPEYLDSLDPSANLERLRSRLGVQDRTYSCLVAEQCGTVAGFANFGSARFPAEANTCELCALNVLPSHWGAGLGGRLVSAALNAAKTYGYSRVMLWCISGNSRACNLYERHGFVLTDAHRINHQLTGIPFEEVCYVHSF